MDASSASKALMDSFSAAAMHWPLIVGYGFLSWLTDMAEHKVDHDFDSALAHYAVRGFSDTVKQDYYNKAVYP